MEAVLLSCLPLEVQATVYDHLCLRDLRALADSCHDLHAVIPAHILRTVHRIFIMFELRPSQMFVFLQQTRAVVSGSCSLLAIMPWDFTPNDMDIYVPQSQANFALDKLQVDFGYSLESGPRAGSSISLILFGYILRHRQLVVNLLVCDGENAVRPIFGFHSTVVMNFISHDTLFCAYPSLTFARRSLLNTRQLLTGFTPIDKTEACISKYESRGYDFSLNLGVWPKVEASRYNLDQFDRVSVHDACASSGLTYHFRTAAGVQQN
jgi:hypothetical protein